MLGNKKIMGDNIQYYLGKHEIERKEFAKPRKIRKDAVSDVSLIRGAEGNRTP